MHSTSHGIRSQTTFRLFSWSPADVAASAMDRRRSGSVCCLAFCATNHLLAVKLPNMAVQFLLLPSRWEVRYPHHNIFTHAHAYAMTRGYDYRWTPVIIVEALLCQSSASHFSVIVVSPLHTKRSFTKRLIRPIFTMALILAAYSYHRSFLQFTVVSMLGKE